MYITMLTHFSGNNHVSLYNHVITFHGVALKYTTWGVFRYTYGQPVKGTVHLSTRVQGTGYYHAYTSQAATAQLMVHMTMAFWQWLFVCIWVKDRYIHVNTVCIYCLVVIFHLPILWNILMLYFYLFVYVFNWNRLL